MSDQVLRRIKDIRDSGSSPAPPLTPPAPPSADDDVTIRSASSTASMSHSASDVFKLLSPYLPPTEAPKVLRTISEAFANAQSRISAAEGARDAAQVRLRQSER